MSWSQPDRKTREIKSLRNSTKNRDSFRRCSAPRSNHGGSVRHSNLARIGRSPRGSSRDVEKELFPAFGSEITGTHPSRRNEASMLVEGAG
jgi:hypothetical protein